MNTQAIEQQRDQQHSGGEQLQAQDYSQYKAGASKSVSAVFYGGYPHFERPEVIQLIFRSALFENPYNPRKYTPADQMAELIASLQDEGIVKPLVIMRGPTDRDAYLLSGHRRIEASQFCQFDLIPCQLNPNDLTESEIRKQLILHNEKDVKPAPIDRAMAFHDYMVSAGISQADLVREFGMKNDNEITKLFRLLQLPKTVQDLVNRGRIRETAADSIAQHPGGQKAMEGLARDILRDGLTVNQVKNIVDRARRPVPGSSSGQNRPRPQRTTDREFFAGRDRRIKVHVSSKRIEANDDQIAAALIEIMQNELTISMEMPVHHLLKKPDVEAVDVLHSSIVDGAAAPSPSDSGTSITEDTASEPVVEEEEKTIPVCDVWDGDLAPLEAALTVALPEFIQTTDTGIALPEPVLEALQLPLTNETLRKIKATKSEVTAYSTSQWLKRRAMVDNTVTLLEVIGHWGWCKSYVEASQKQVFTGIEMTNIPLDTPTTDSALSSNTKGDLITQYDAALKRLAPVVEGPLMLMREARGVAHALEVASAKLAGNSVSREDLNEAGVPLTTRGQRSFFQWLPTVHRDHRSSIVAGSPAVIDLAEYAHFLGRSYELTIQLTGGGDRIGRTQLIKNDIPYSQIRPQGSGGGGHSTRAVLNELQDSIEKFSAKWGVDL